MSISLIIFLLGGYIAFVWIIALVTMINDDKSYSLGAVIGLLLILPILLPFIFLNFLGEIEVISNGNKYN